MTLHCVYYCYNAENEIIYIGCTKNLTNRFSQHKSRSAWVNNVHDVRLRWFGSSGEALMFEERAILRNKPEYNRLEAVVQNGRMFWVKPKREVVEMSESALIKFKSIQKSLRVRLNKRLALERNAKRVQK